MNDHSTTGDRIRRLRKLRGMTQEDLRRAARLSLRTIKDAEGGDARLRNETLHKIAVALQVHTSDLLKEGVPEAEAVTSLDGQEWGDVRDALYRRVPRPGTGEPATAAGVLAVLGDLRPDWHAGRYSAARVLLPGLVADALDLGFDDPGDRHARSVALTAAASMLTMTRQFGDAEVAASLALDAAPEMPDKVAAVVMQTWGLLRQGRPGEARELAVRWSDETEPARMSRATSAEIACWGRMLLYVANAATTDNRPGEAADALRMAKTAAAATGREVAFNAEASPGMFGPATVAVIAAETAALTWQPDKVLAIAERTRTAGIEPAQQHRHQLDIASAHSMRRDWPAVVEVMQGVRRVAPEWLACQRYGRDILEGVVRRRRGPLTQELRDLATAVRLPM